MESFKKLQQRDWMLLLAAIILWFVVGALMQLFVGPQSSYIVALFVVSLLVALTVYISGRSWIALLFFTVGALVTSGMENMGVTGSEKFIVFLVAGIVFELVFVLLKIEIKNIPLDITMGVAIAAASIPITTGFVLSSQLMVVLLKPMINLALVSFFIGLCGALVALLIWSRVRTTKFTLRFRFDS